MPLKDNVVIIRDMLLESALLFRNNLYTKGCHSDCCEQKKVQRGKTLGMVKETGRDAIFIQTDVTKMEYIE